MAETGDERRRRLARERQRRYRDRKRAERERASVVVDIEGRRPDSGDDEGPGGSVVAAVRAELQAASVDPSRSAQGAMAVRLAELLDDPSATPQVPAAAGRLREVLDGLRDEPQQGGALARIRAARADRGPA